MDNPFASHTAGWITLSVLLAFAPQLSGCDTSAPSEKGETSANPTENSTSRSAKAGVKTAEVKGEVTDAREKKIEDGKSSPPSESKSDAISLAEIEGAPSVKRLVIASDVDQREPIELTEAKIKEPVVAFLELKNDAEVDSGVRITFEHESGKKVGFIELDVPKESPRYRTWGRTRNITDPGEWTAVVTSKSGEELARKSFTVAG